MHAFLQAQPASPGTCTSSVRASLLDEKEDDRYRLRVFALRFSELIVSSIVRFFCIDSDVKYTEFELIIYIYNPVQEPEEIE